MIRTLLFAFIFHAMLAGELPEAFYLTWEKQPESTVVVNWLTRKQETQKLTVRQAGAEAGQSMEVTPIPLQNHSSYFFYQAKVEGLKPDSRYELVLEGVEKPYSWYTLPEKLDRDLKFIVGGDIYHDGISFVADTNKMASKLNPDFALLGGDIAYAAPKISFLGEDEERWLDFLRTYTETMVRDDGTLIPLMAAIGNHDVTGHFDSTPEKAKIFYRLFIPSGTSYRAIDLAGHLSIIFLDTDHSNSIQKQVPFLEEALKGRGNMPVKFAIYHVPAYPSARAYHNARSARVRRYFVPVFEKYGLTAAFEHHDHTFKRTHLLKEGKVNPEGVLYMGDGSWGVETPRQPRTPKQSWYIARSAKVRQVLLVTVKKEGNLYESYDDQGQLVDRYTH